VIPTNGIRPHVYYQIVITFVNEFKNRSCFKYRSNCSSDSTLCNRSFSSNASTSLRRIRWLPSLRLWLPSLRWLRWLLLLIKTRPRTSRVTNTRSFFYYTVMDGDLYPDVIMMLQAIDLKSEKLNPIHYLHGEQHRSLMSNFTSVMFLRLQHVDYSH
jgi:hypothetical protein